MSWLLTKIRRVSLWVCESLRGTHTAERESWSGLTYGSNHNMKRWNDKQNKYRYVWVITRILYLHTAEAVTLCSPWSLTTLINDLTTVHCSAQCCIHRLELLEPPIKQRLLLPLFTHSLINATPRCCLEQFHQQWPLFYQTLVKTMLHLSYLISSVGRGSHQS